MTPRIPLFSIALLTGYMYWAACQVRKHADLEAAKGSGLAEYLGAIGNFPARPWLRLLLMLAVPNLILPILVGTLAKYWGNVPLMSITWSYAIAGFLVDQVSTHAIPTWWRTRKNEEPAYSPGLQNWLQYAGLALAGTVLLYILGGRLVPLALLAGAASFLSVWLLVLVLSGVQALKLRVSR